MRSADHACPFDDILCTPTRDGGAENYSVDTLPERIEGKYRDVWIKAGKTVATARSGLSLDGHGADLWRIEGDSTPWRVRVATNKIHRFSDEQAAATFFARWARMIADGLA